MKLTLAAGLFVAASAAAFAQAPAGSSNSPSATQQRPGTAASAQQNTTPTEQTLTGCLTSADNIYTLTVLDDKGAPGTTAETTQYTLATGSGVDLQPHLNKRVTVKGTDAGPGAQTSDRVVMNTPAAPAATGTSGATPNNSGGARTSGANAGASNSGAAAGGNGGAAPKVETTAKTRINTKTFNVTNVMPAAGSCGA